MVNFDNDSLSTKEVLINEALNQFAQSGIMQSSVRSICKCIGQSTASIGYHFGSKEGLVEAVVEECLKRLQYPFNRFEEGGDFIEAAIALSEYTAGHSRELYVLYQITFSQDFSFFDKMRSKVNQILDRFFIHFKAECNRRGIDLSDSEIKVRSSTFLQSLMQEVLSRQIGEGNSTLSMKSWTEALLRALLSKS